jgi:hypothetical protein
MRPFKFFQKEVKGTLDLFDGETRATASFSADTPEGVMGRRRLYHTDINQYDRLRHPNDPERFRLDRITRRINGGMSQEEVLRRRHESFERDLNETEQYLTFFSPITVTKVNPKWWMKIKIFFQEMKIKMYIQDNSDMFGVIFFAAAVTICFGLIIGKLLNVW